MLREILDEAVVSTKDFKYIRRHLTILPDAYRITHDPEATPSIKIRCFEFSWVTDVITKHDKDFAKWSEVKNVTNSVPELNFAVDIKILTNDEQTWTQHSGGLVIHPVFDIIRKNLRFLFAETTRIMGSIMDIAVTGGFASRFRTTQMEAFDPKESEQFEPDLVNSKLDLIANHMYDEEREQIHDMFHRTGFFSFLKEKNVTKTEEVMMKAMHQAQKEWAELHQPELVDSTSAVQSLLKSW
jgi:hypothetical protein